MVSGKYEKRNCLCGAGILLPGRMNQCFPGVSIWGMTFRVILNTDIYIDCVKN